MSAAVQERYEVTEIQDYNGRVIRTILTCLHVDTVPVVSVVTGEVLAHLCPDCDKQLP